MAYSGITKHKRSFVDAMIEDHIRMDIRRYAYPNHLIGAVHAVLTDRPFARSAKMLSKEILKDFPALAYPYPLHPRPLHPLAFENVLQDAVMRATESLLLASYYQKLKDGAAALLANNEEVNEKLHHAITVSQDASNKAIAHLNEEITRQLNTTDMRFRRRVSPQEAHHATLLPSALAAVVNENMDKIQPKEFQAILQKRGQEME